MSDKDVTHIWPILTFTNAPAMAEFIVEAFGFEAGTTVVSESVPSVILHGELRWPLVGGVMYGTAGKDDTPFGNRVPGNDAVYIVTDDPDGLYERCQKAGAEVIFELADADYGSRGFSVVDPEGNRWSFGTYAGA